MNFAKFLRTSLVAASINGNVMSSRLKGFHSFLEYFSGFFLLSDIEIQKISECTVVSLFSK